MTSLTLDSKVGKHLIKSRIVAVLVVDDVADAIGTTEALLAGGIDTMELTLRTPAALEAAAQIAHAYPEMCLGIGTILSTEQVDASIAAGVDFGVSPGVNPEVIRHARSQDLPFGPGVMTPTDVDAAIREGCEILKYFPSESSGGLAHLKNIAAPFSHLGPRFIPLGGVTVSNLATYLENELVAAVGGSWLAPRDLIRERNWKQIEANAREARAIAT